MQSAENLLEDDIMGQAFFKRLCEFSFIKAVYLYGSRARGDNDNYSDYDLAIDCPGASFEQWNDITDLLDNALFVDTIQCVRYDTLKEGLFKQQINKYKKVLCFELTWKNLRRLLRVRGIQANSPVMTFREAYQEKLIEDKDIFKSMLEDRNAVTHKYFQQQAEEIYKRLPDYLKVMRKLHENLKHIYIVAMRYNA